MKSMVTKLALGMCLIMIASMFTAVASAQCGSLETFRAGTVKPQSWRSQIPAGGGSLVLVAEPESDESIVGLWRVTFIAKGNVGIPDGVVVDKAFAQWHRDGTEIMNSSRPPATSSFCLGIWKKVRSFKYKLNHFAISWDPNNNAAPLGLANIREEVVLSPDRESFTGDFTIDQYDQHGNVLVHIQGQLLGTRINVDTTVANVM
jgi:hypothetical protein